LPATEVAKAMTVFKMLSVIYLLARITRNHITCNMLELRLQCLVIAVRLTISRVGYITEMIRQHDIRGIEDKKV
jgi:hypothetical protein